MDSSSTTRSKFAFLDKIKQSKHGKKISIVLAALIILSGSSAAAYFGYAVPNRPENVIKKTLENSLELHHVSGTGVANLDISGEDKFSGKLTYDIKSDRKNAEIKLEATASGVKLPLEIRVLDKTLYAKVGDISTIKSLAAGYLGPESGTVINAVSDKISNQWIEFDETLLKTANDKCSVDGLQMTQKDIDELLALYNSNQFVTVKSHMSDAVGDKKAEKYALGLDKTKAASFGKSVENTDFVKRLNACTGDQAKNTNEELQKADDKFKGSTEFNVWIDKSKKKLLKMEFKLKDDKTNLVSDFTFNDAEVNVTKPEGAKPAMQLYGDILPLLGGGAASPATGADAAAAEAGVTADCLAAYQTYTQTGDMAALSTACASAQ